MALLILALLQRIFLMSSLMLLLVWLIFFMVLIKLLDRKSGSAGMPRPISYAVFCLKKKKKTKESNINTKYNITDTCLYENENLDELFLWFTRSRSSVDVF